jgi:hypothetical protein
MEELMTAVFVAHTKVLTAVRLSTKQKKLSITVPKLDHFVHRIFRETARAFWKTPFLFMDGNNVVERQKNVLQIEAAATEAITTAVRSLLPVKQILKDYLEDDEDDEVSAPATPVTHVSEAKEAEAEAEAEEAAILPVETAKAPAPVVTPATAVTPSSSSPSSNSVVNIDTEPSVSFSEYDEVFSKSSAPELVRVPRMDDDDGPSDGPSDGTLQIDESSSKSISMDDAEDLEAPKVKAKPQAVPALPPKEEDIVDDLVVLE